MFFVASIVLAGAGIVCTGIDLVFSIRMVRAQSREVLQKIGDKPDDDEMSPAEANEIMQMIEPISKKPWRGSRLTRIVGMMFIFGAIACLSIHRYLN